MDINNKSSNNLILELCPTHIRAYNYEEDIITYLCDCYIC